MDILMDGRPRWWAAMPMRLSYPLLYLLLFRHHNFLKKSLQRHDCSATALHRASRPSSSPPPRLATSRAAPCHAPIHFTHRRRRGRGGLRLPPHSARPSAGRGGLRATPRVYAGPLLSTAPGPELTGYRSSPPCRLCPPAMLCFKCFNRFRLMFQLFHLNVASRSWMSDMLQTYVSSISGVSNVCFKCFTWMLHMLLWLVSSVSHVSDSCYKCFIWMLQK
jgi:hypothetical protein